MARKFLFAAVQVQQDKASGCVSEVVDARHSLLSAVAALGQMHCRTDPAHFVRQGAMVGVTADPWHCGCDSEGFEGPRARDFVTEKSIKFSHRNDDLAATEGSGTLSHVPQSVTSAITTGVHTSFAGKVRRHQPCRILGNRLPLRLPHDRVVLGDIREVDAQHEAHSVEVLEQI